MCFQSYIIYALLNPQQMHSRKKKSWNSRIYSKLFIGWTPY